jgi:deoxyribodipyrimidine photo-lyase
MSKRSLVLSATETQFPSKRTLATPSFPFNIEKFNAQRARLINRISSAQQPCDSVVLWMSRDQRIEDNHAFWYAQSIALAQNIPLKVIFNLVPNYPEATVRQYGFMLKGLREVETKLRALSIPFYLLRGDPIQNVAKFAQSNRAVAVVTDFSPMRISLGWVKGVGSELEDDAHPIPLVQVDAHNIIPCWVASTKQEYMAKQMRARIHSQLSAFLTDVPPAPVGNSNGSSALADCPPVNWEDTLQSLNIDRSVDEVNWISPGSDAAMAALVHFAETKLKDYGEKSNDPTVDCSSKISPYLHFGQISSLRIFLYLKSLKKHLDSTDRFIEQCVVRKELTDNFCFCKSSCALLHYFY